MWSCVECARFVHVDAPRPRLQVVAHGKSKKSSKRRADDAATPEAAETRAAPRIQPRPRISIKTQIAIVRYMEEEQRKAKVKQSFTRQTFRKASKSPEELQAEREEAIRQERALRRRRGDPTLSSIYGTGNRTGAPVLLVDGYNLLGYHAKLRSLRATNLQHAREKLEMILANYAANVATVVAIVWDAMGNPESTVVRGSRSSQSWEVSSIFTANLEADTYIVRAVRLLLDSKAEYVLVATGDIEEGDLAREEGAYVVKCDQLMAEVARVKKESTRDLLLLQEQSKAVSVAMSFGNLLGNVQVTDKSKAAEFEAMLASFVDAADHEQARAMNMSAGDYYAHRRRELLKARRAERDAASDSESGSESDGGSGDEGGVDLFDDVGETLYFKAIERPGVALGDDTPRTEGG